MRDLVAFLELHLFYAQKGLFPIRLGDEECLATTARYVTSDKPWAAYVKLAYDHFMQVIEGNRSCAPEKDQLEHNYASRSAISRLHHKL